MLAWSHRRNSVCMEFRCEFDWKPSCFPCSSHGFTRVLFRLTYKLCVVNSTGLVGQRADDMRSYLTLEAGRHSLHWPLKDYSESRLDNNAWNEKWYFDWVSLVTWLHVALQKRRAHSVGQVLLASILTSTLRSGDTVTSDRIERCCYC